MNPRIKRIIIILLAVVLAVILLLLLYRGIIRLRNRRYDDTPKDIFPLCYGSGMTDDTAAARPYVKVLQQFYNQYVVPYYPEENLTMLAIDGKWGDAMENAMHAVSAHSNGIITAGGTQYGKGLYSLTKKQYESLASVMNV